MGACDGVSCIPNATCQETDLGVTCRCLDGYSGYGFVKCTKVEGVIIADDYIYVIVFIVLLFVGLLVILIYFLCRRRILDKSEDEPLVPSGENQYDMKWRMVLNDKDVPPSYSDISETKVPPAEITTFYVEPQAQPDHEQRVPVKLEEDDFGDGGIDNPSYEMMAEVKEDDSSHASEVSESPIQVEEEAPVETEVPVLASDDAVSEDDEDDAYEEPLDKEVEEPIPEDVSEQPITITFQENEDLPNTVTASVTTPTANLTINLNINVPTVSTEEASTEEE